MSNYKNRIEQKLDGLSYSQLANHNLISGNFPLSFWTEQGWKFDFIKIDNSRFAIGYFNNEEQIRCITDSYISNMLDEIINLIES